MRRFALAACLLSLSVGCPHRAAAPQLTGPLDAAELAARVAAAHEHPSSLTADSKAFVDAPENGGKYALHVSVKRPASLRIEALTPIGDPAAVLVAHQGRFALFDLRRNEFYRGPSTPQNLSRLFPVPLQDGELVSLFLGAIPELKNAKPVSAAPENDYYKIVYSGDDGLSQEVLVHQDDLRVLKVTRTSGQTLLWTLTLEEHDGALPTAIKLAVPDQKISLDLRVKNQRIDKPPPFGAFALEPPAGVKVVELQ